jgi:hypothetical protein
MIRSKYVLALAAAILLSGCDYIIEHSKFNLTSEQMARMKSIDYLDKDEFKIDMPAFLSEQLSSLEKRLAAKGMLKQTANESGFCKANASFSIAGFTQSAPIATLSPMIYGSSLAGDRVIDVSLVTASMATPDHKNTLAAGIPHGTKLGFADFEAFRKRITDASNAQGQGITLPGTQMSASANTFVADVMLDAGAAAKVPLLGYLGAYYTGKFVDRFGNPVDKPIIKNGLDDGTISAFIRILLETGADSIKPYEPVVRTSKTPDKFYGKDKSPTFHEFLATELIDVEPNGSTGVSAKESKLIEAGSNFIAEQGLTFFGGLLEFLGGVDIGFVVAPNFTIGSNHTLKAIARSVIETALRRGAERGIYCLAEKYDVDALASVIK